MSDTERATDAALHKIEEGLREWFEANHIDPDHPRHGKGDVVVDWVAAITVSNIIDVDGKEIVGYANLQVAPLGNPNAHVGLAMWLAEDIGEIMHPEEE